MSKKITSLLGRWHGFCPPQLVFAETKHLKKALVSAAALAFMGLGTANAQTDVTSTYIKNADLSSMDGWTKSNFNNATKGSTSNDGYASEAYAGWGSLNIQSYALTQQITLPAGSYTLVNYSFYREGGAYNTDASISKAYLKAGDAQVAIKTLGSITAKSYANSQGEGANVFGSTMYRNTLEFKLEEQKTIEIGITGTFTQAKSWCIVGKFQLFDNSSKNAHVLDVTHLLTNPGFEYNNMTGWTLDGKSTFGTQSNNSYNNKKGSYYAEKWQSVDNGGLPDGKMSQTLTGLASGKYQLKANVKFDGTGAYIQAGDKVTDVTPKVSWRYSAATDVTDGNLTIAAGLKNSTSNWICFDDFTLTYIPNTVNDADANLLINSATELENSYMNAEVKEALANAKSALEKAKTADNYVVLDEAIMAAQYSIKAYANAKSALESRANLLALTNFYKADASFYATPLAAYNAATLTSAEGTLLEDPYGATKIGSKTSTQINPFFGAAWDVSDYKSTPYVNTWSTEGDTDGSNFKVPFYEYWVNANNPLGDKTLKGTIGSLKANTTYTITADVRVQIYDSGNAPAIGISMQVGDGEAVAITGKQIGTSKLYLDTYTAVGKTDNEGNLTLKFNVASTNVSWLSFQHVWYAEVPTEVTLDEAQTYAATDDDVLANVTLTRTLTTNWNTIVLPFALSTEQVKAAFGEAVKVAEYTGVTEAGTKTTLNFSTVTETKANTPYMIRPAQAGTTYKFEGVTLEKAGDLTAGTGDIKFMGNYTNGKSLSEGDYFIDASDNTFYRSANKETMKSFRAIFHADNATAAKLAISIDGDQTTAISDVNAKPAATSFDVYSVSGMLVKKGVTQLDGLAKGVYIVNGKSYIVK